MDNMVQINKPRLRQLLEAELLLELLTDYEVDMRPMVAEFCKLEGFKSWDDAIDTQMKREEGKG